ncbi:hypothetical protein PGH46_01510 [Legionella pneumophila]|nr:hypothetical protein PGH46_01510 [Legionella pneumophila]
MNQEIPIYQIIGACNPQLAHRDPSSPSAIVMLGKNICNLGLMHQPNMSFPAQVETPFYPSCQDRFVPEKTQEQIDENHYLSSLF